MLARLKKNFRVQLVILGLLLGLIAYTVTSNAAQTIPVPRLLVTVHTVSGSVSKDTLVPIGGVPVPIDVDNGTLLGLLCPDIDVSIGLIAADELPGKPLVPNIIVRRDPLAIIRNAPAPNLSLNARIIIDDIGNNKVLATVDYGFSTPPGARMPPEVRAKLVGPITSGFVDPLQAKIDTPGYAGPLDFAINARTETFNGNFGLKFDPIPESIAVTEDPRDDGLDFTYDHVGSVPDVHLDGSADLTDLTTGEVRHIRANVERLPNHLQLSNTNTTNKTLLEFQSQSQTARPDIEADYRDTLGNGNVTVDANIKVAALPTHMTGEIDTTPTPTGSDLDGVDFHVLDNQEIGSVDFTAKNYLGTNALIPETQLGPDPFVAVTTRRLSATKTLFRASGHIEAIRGGTFKRMGANKDQLDVQTDVGDGTKPLRAILDTDTRGAPASENPKHMKVDATVTPLPKQIHAFFAPSVGSSPLHLVYDSSAPIDIDANVAIAKGASDNCGDDQVVCAQARVDKIPSHMDVKLPGEGGTDFSISNAGTATLHPDVRATVDIGPDSSATPPVTTRTWVNAELLRIPKEVRGRMDAAGGALRAAEFHGCAWDFNATPKPKCTDAQDAIGRVSFTVRDNPVRASVLPAAPDVGKQFVTLISRHHAPVNKQFEVQGRIDEVRNVVFHQLDRNPGDDKTDGVLGVLVDVGAGGQPFDLYVDSIDDAFNKADPPQIIPGDDIKNIAVNVAALPRTFTACVRSNDEVAPPDPSSLPKDDLLAPCESTDVVTPGPSEHAITPLTANYTAVDQNGNPAPTKITAHVTSTAPDLDDKDLFNAPIPATSKLDLTIDKVPGSLRADVIPPITPDPAHGVAGRRLQLKYGASSKIDKIDFALENRRATSICEDPRPNRKALCLSGTLKNLPANLTATFDPDESKGDIDFTSDPPGAMQPKLSIDPLFLSKVSADPKSQPLAVEAHINGITPHLVGKFVSLHTAQDPPNEKSLAAMNFNACPPGSAADCAGIDSINFTATNALVGDPLSVVDVPDKDPDTTQDFTFVQRGEDYRAHGEISQLKEIGLSKLKTDGTPGPTTKVRAAFGTGSPTEKLRAYIDRQTVTDPDTNAGLEEQVVNAVISKVPKALNLCYRDKLNPGDVPDPQSSPTADFCDKAPADKLAVQTRLDDPATTTKPDIDIRKLHLAKGGGTDFLDGTVFIGDLAQRIDVLAGKGDKTDLVVEGHNLNDGPADPPQDVASRVRFDLRNYDGSDDGTGLYPFKSLNGAQDPEDDPRIVDGSDKNFVKVVKDVNNMLLKGSIPDIKRVALQPGPCFPDDPQTPPVSAFTDPTMAPEYQCVNLIAGQNKPLGLAIRTKDEKNEILSMDEGYISSVPGGDGGIFATLGKSPKKAKLNPTCGEPVVGGTPAEGCKPELLSVQAKKASGQTSNLQARLAIGDEGLVNDLKNTTPLDEFSKRLNYEAPVATYTEGADGLNHSPDEGAHGARVKLSTGKKGTAVRAGFNLDLPDYLDLDQPLSYSCKRDDLSGGVLDPDSAACNETDVSSEANHGYESKDIAIRLVGSNTKHLGTDLASLGRAAVFIVSNDDGKQTLLTGAPPADPNNHGTIDDNPTLSPPETAPPTGAWDLGLNLPGYLDARVAIRSKYQIDDEDNDKQSTFYQIDGRVNTPLTLALRDVQSAALDGSLQTGRTRSGKDVAALQLALRNAAGLGGSYQHFDQPGDRPSFRLRAEMRKGKHEDDTGPYKCNGFNPGGGRTAGFGANFCLYTPGDHLEKWMDVGLNMNPAEGSSPARTVDVAMDSKDYTQIDMHGFADVDGSGGDLGKGAFADFTPQAGLRLAPFPIGLEMGLGLGIVGGNTKLLLDGDLILKLSAPAAQRLRLSQNKGAIRLLAESSGGPTPAATVKTDDEAHAIVQVRAEALFGLISDNIVDVDAGPYHQPVEFKKCEFPNIGIFLGSDDYFPVDPNDSTKAAIVLPPTGTGDFVGDAANVINAVSEVLAPIWCLVGTDDNHLVDGGHPAPAFDEPGHPISDVAAAPPTPPAPPADTTPPSGDITVGPSSPDGATQTFCNTLGAKTLHVENGGTLRVGRDNETVSSFVDNDGPGGQPPVQITTQCTGKLVITADNVIVDAGGTIDAGAKITAAGPGTPTTSGDRGGASHSGLGGDSGAGGAGAGVNYGSTDSPGSDIGSPARTGAGGGFGGGAISIQATDTITVNGQISAAGGAGTGGGSCTGGGGGSGGHIQLKALAVNLGNTAGDRLNSRGGNGASEGGGGGGGGRITIDTIAPKPTNNSSTSGGSGGAKGSCANPGDPGTAGATHGTVINQAAGVTFDTTADFVPQYVKDTVPLKYTGVSNNGGELYVIVCQRNVGVSSSIDDPALDPPAGGTPGDIIDSSHCTSHHFNNPTSGNRYVGTVSVPVSDGFHGFYAVAATPPAVKPLGFDDCLDASGFFNDFCTYQESVTGSDSVGDDILPSQSSVKVASDKTPPDVAFTNPNGDAGCAGGRLCLNQAGTMKVTAGDTQGGIGLASVNCNVNGGPFNIPCGPGDTVTVDLGTTDGPADVQIQATDRLGNQKTIDGPHWFTDRSAGDTPTITMTQTDANPTNTWYHSAPHVTVHAEDNGSGFVGKPVTFFTDTSSHQCGTITNTSISFPPFGSFSVPNIVDCLAGETDAWVPAQGIHTFQAQATDRLGNKSLKSDIVTMKVDGIGPKTFIFVGPKLPDGGPDSPPVDTNWYKTKPFVAFRGVDTVGGSGVNLSHPSGESKIQFKVDAGGYVDWNPESPNELNDGIHTVCARSSDVAGNTGPEVCRSNIKVDTTAPNVTDPVSPAAPNGGSGWYTSKPTVTPTASDPGSSPSGIATKQMRIDGGDWVPMAPAVMQEGIHTIQVRASDVAGNVTLLPVRTYKVDLSKPNSHIGSYPPAPNGQGWFRQSRLDYVAAHDGRDGSGAVGSTVSIDGGLATPYTAPFVIGQGVHSASVRAVDAAGLQGDPQVQSSKVDVTPPVAAPDPTQVGPITLIQDLLGHLLPALTGAQLKFNVTDNLSKVRVNVIVYNALEGVVKVIPAAGGYPGGYRDPGAGSVNWDGSGLDGLGVLPGLYHYRVQATDQAGNTILSTESPTFAVVLGILPQVGVTVLGIHL